MGAKYFLLEQTLFQKGTKSILKELPPLEVLPFVLKKQLLWKSLKR